MRHRPDEGERRRAPRSHDLAAGHILTSPLPAAFSLPRRSGACTLTSQWSRTLVLGALAHWPVLTRPRLAGFQVSTEGEGLPETPTRPQGRATAGWCESPPGGAALFVPSPAPADPPSPPVGGSIRSGARQSTHPPSTSTRSGGPAVPRDGLPGVAADHDGPGFPSLGEHCLARRVPRGCLAGSAVSITVLDAG